jgi:hypothetical protein
LTITWEYGVGKKKTLKRHIFKKTPFHTSLLENGIVQMMIAATYEI